MAYRRYSNQNRVTDRDRIYLDDYVMQLQEDADTLIGSVGDSVRLLKNYKVITHEIDHKGDVTPKGRHGGRRQLQPTNIIDPERISSRGGEYVARPKEDNSYILPAIVDVQPSDEARAIYGLKDNEYGIVTVARLFLETRGIEIDPSKDYFNIYGTVYKIRLANDDGGYLDSRASFVYTVKKDF